MLVRSIDKVTSANIENLVVTRMFNPPHPGEVFRKYFGEATVTGVALQLHVTRAALSRILNGSAGVSADMALRLGDALGTSSEMWAGLQMQHDLHRAAKKPRLRVKRLVLGSARKLATVQ